MANEDAQQAEDALEAEFVTATQALTLLGVGKPKLAQMIRDGELPTYPDPRHKQIKRIKVSDIQAWLKRAGPPRKRKPKKPSRNKERRRRPKNSPRRLVLKGQTTRLEAARVA